MGTQDFVCNFWPWSARCATPHPSAGGSDIFDLLCKRFEATHKCTVVSSQECRLEDYPGLLAHFSRAEAKIALAEFQPQMHWGFWEARLDATGDFS